jgi:hypothetical protein
MLRLAALEHHGPPSDDDLTAAADVLFLRLDRDEEQQPAPLIRSGKRTTNEFATLVWR